MYKNVIVKVSGEALKGSLNNYGIDPIKVKEIAKEIKQIKDLGISVSIVCGAGNLWRGVTGEQLGMDRATADYMGMLGTIMNGLALQDALKHLGVTTRVMTALQLNTVAEPYIRGRALMHLEKGHVNILVGGTGSPYFSTDTAAALRAAELHCDMIIMAKNGVDGVYDKDPNKFSDAKLYERISLKKIIDDNLEVMDQTAATMCLQNKVDIVVVNMNINNNMKKAAMGEKIGTRVSWED